VLSQVPQVPPQQSASLLHVLPSAAQPQAPSTQRLPQQSPSWEQPAPSAPPDAPPQVLSQVPHEPPQQSLSWPQPAPSAPPIWPPQVLSQVPQETPLQQSASTAHPAPLSAHPHSPEVVQLPEQQSVPAPQVSPSCAPEAPPQVLSQVPQVAPLQQSVSTWHDAPVSPHGSPQVPALQTKPSEPQQSVSVVQVAPSCPQALAPHMPALQTREPQQSPSWEQVSPLLAQPHVPALQMEGAQQSALAEQLAPAAWQAQVRELVSQRSTPQQSSLLAQVSPLPLHTPASAPPDVQVMLVASQVVPEQQPEGDADGSQSPPCPAQAA
jgi:hypothetical protein